MPAIKISGTPYRFTFFSNEGDEPPHVHVHRENKAAKFWLRPLRLAANDGFARHELNRIEKLVIKYQSEIQKKWNEHFEH